MSEISNSDDIIDSRDVIKRIEQLEEEGQYDGDELIALKKLAEQCEGYGDWAHGETLIRESHFKEYAQQLAEDIGRYTPGGDWPLNCIDWEQAAKELAYDYTEVDFDGVAYLMRS